MKKTLILVLTVVCQQAGLLGYWDHGGAGVGIGAGLVGAGILGAAIASHHHDKPQVVYVREEPQPRAERVVNEEEGEYIANQEESQAPARETQPIKKVTNKFKSAAPYPQEPVLDEDDGDNSNTATADNTLTPEIVYEDED